MRVVIAVILASLVAVLTHAQPTPPPTPDLERARTEYAAAEKAMAAGLYDDASNHYANAYRASKDAAVLYKLGVARQKANDCPGAVRLFASYLQLGKPPDDFATLTRDRMRQCGGDPDQATGVPADPVAGWGVAVIVPTPGSGDGSAVGSGSASPGGGSAKPDPGAGSADPGANSGSAAPLPKPIAPPRHRAAWLFVGGAIAAATVGAVLAYSANAAEQDIDDLYIGLGGNPPRFNDATRKQYDDLVKEGERYELLSWVSFGVAAALGGVAAYRFATDEKPKRVQVTPTASPTGAGVSAIVRF